MSGHHHGGGATLAPVGTRRVALVGSPNCGKTTLFNALTGLHARTGNYPGVTVARFEGTTRVGDEDLAVEDLPGTYSLDPISPDEQVVADVLAGEAEVPRPDAVLMLMDATSLRRSLGLLSHVLHVGLPVCVVLTFRDQLVRRRGSLDVAALERALGVPVVPVTSGDKAELAALRDRLADPDAWDRPVVLPPTDPAELTGWVDSVLTSSRYDVPELDGRTQRLDRVLLHPLWGSLVFFATMFAFFQVIFTVAAPLQDLVEGAFGWLSDQAAAHLGDGWLSSFVGDALIGGVGGVLVFLPQIILLFLMISLLEGSGYLSRAAFLMDRVMATVGLEGRAFVALLSSMACAIPGIMATRSLPSAKDRLATMMGAPLMTCSARLPVYVLLIGMLVPDDARVGPFGAQGAVMFALYLGGAVSAMLTAAFFKRLTGRRGPALPFYMEMPSYAMPTARNVAASVWGASRAFVSKVGRVILAVTVVLWLLLNLPARGDADLRAAGVNPSDTAATAQYTLDHSYGAGIGKAVEPVFEPLGFDWRIDIGVLASLSARETFVATLGQVAAASDPEDPQSSLSTMTHQDGPHAGQKLFDAPTTTALLVFFLYALQCMSTIATMRRETGTWLWPGVAFGYMFVLAWTMAFLAHTIVAALT